MQKKTGAADLDLPLVNEPGAQWTYGASTRVLGMVIEKISGLTIDKYLEARILGPLGMKDTTYAVPSSKTARVVSRNQRTDGKSSRFRTPTRFRRRFAVTAGCIQRQQTTAASCR